MKNLLLQYKKACYYYGKNHKKTDANWGKFRKIKNIFDFLMNGHVSLIKNNVSPELSSSLQFSEMVKWMKLRYEHNYVYPYDVCVIKSIPPHVKPIASVTPDYRNILEGNLVQKQIQIQESQLDDDFKHALQIQLDSILELVKKITQELQLRKDNNDRNRLLIKYIDRIKNMPVESFDEALQRILFFNGLFWQNMHRHNGIGRLDLLLYPYYKNDCQKGILTYESAKAMLCDFLAILGSDMSAKSLGELIGDTGQVIILGGIDKDCNLVENDITYLLLDIFKESPMPDPKLLLRVNANTTDMVWQKAIEAITRGSGSPLIINEDMVIPQMVGFGYAPADCYNFGTSACWEPLIIGKSLDQNNAIRNITIVDALFDPLRNSIANNFDEFIVDVKKAINSIIADFDLNIQFDYSSLFSLYFDDCIANNKDFGNGGARYNYHGLLIVGLPNLVNSLLNIKEYVFKKRMYSLLDCLECINSNYVGHEDMLRLFRSGDSKFGRSIESVVNLTNELMSEISKAVSKRTIKGSRIKVGFSSPSYIGLAKEYPASLDGRKKGEPFAVHISPISSRIDISEILDFASKLDYRDNRINGNVVDFILPATYVKMPDKLVSIIRNACAKGVFELQLNVLDKKILLDAKANPDKYPNLIVRVWGFSAYFNDLPQEYKDNLIARAELYE